MIPKVRKWRVRFFSGGKITHETEVLTINRRFAKWLANEKLGYPLWESERVTITIVP